MAALVKRGSTYYLKWRENGVQKLKSLKTGDKKKAQLLLNGKNIELSTGRNPVPSADTFENLSGLYVDWHARRYPSSHERVYGIIRDRLVPFFGQYNAAAITPMLVERWISSREKSRPAPAVETINKELRTLQAILNKAVDWDIIGKNLIRKTVRPVATVASQPHNFYTPEQLRKLYEHAKEYAPVWKLLANTGLRRAEAMNLKWSNIRGNHIHILSDVGTRTKSGKWRDVPLSPGALEALESLKGSDATYVLPRVTLPSLSRAFAKAATRSGNVGSMHDLRHTFISQLVMQGVPLRTVQVIAGHSTIAVTEKYAHASPDHLASAVAKLSL